jgi:hypothetical protein
VRRARHEQPPRAIRRLIGRLLGFLVVRLQAGGLIVAELMLPSIGRAAANQTFDRGRTSSLFSRTNSSMALESAVRANDR